MKKVTLILFLLLFGASSWGQSLQISDFKAAVADGTGADARTAVTDPDEELCAVLRMETKLTGLTFEAGLYGIIDVRYGEGVVYVYLPRSARKISVAHKDYEALRDWPIPMTLEAGRTYSMKLAVETPKPKPAPAPAKRVAHAPTRSQTYNPVAKTVQQPVKKEMAVVPQTKDFCTHFIDAYVGFQCYEFDYGFSMDDYWVGASYTWLEKRVGGYVSAGIDMDVAFSLFAGPAVRLTSPETSGLDLQLYSGIGVMNGSFAVDTGLRFAWRSKYDVSLWDFSIGCQYYDKTIVPTVSVGLGIWGIPVIIGLGLSIIALGSI